MMRPSRFRLKESLLLLPVLLLGGAAFYWQRLEKAAPHKTSDNSIQSIQLQTANGREREKGYSHKLTVILKYDWPKTQTIKAFRISYGSIKSFQHPLKIASPAPGSSPAEYISTLGELIWKHDGKSEVIKNNNSLTIGGEIIFPTSQFAFIHPLALQNLPPNGEIIFHGVYIAGGRSFEIRHPVRKAGEKLTFDNNNQTGGRLLSTECGVWGKHGKDDTLAITFHVHINHTTKKERPIAPLIYDLTLLDGKGHITPYTGNPFNSNQEWQVFPKPDPNDSLTDLNIYLAPGFNPPNPLTLRGKVSIDNNWPIPFSLTLPRHP